ncbi:MAG: AbrB/MazE/SpoVT family DNA-binding domain-containing protein [Candidatus Hydrothermarchaeota archaeon]|nr:AbrB/MazE/SpoVT family DNA-binding domain-containing protein [Candidatus Hydrothermarchaeota archaeon]
MEDAEIAVMGEKGQVVIPKEVRDELKLGPKSKFLVIGYKDTVVLKKLETPNLKKEWEAIKRVVDERIRKYGELTEEEIAAEVHEYRKRKGRLR